MGNTYWSILAKTVNIWRTIGIAKSIYSTWKTLFPNTAKAKAGRLPQRALRGRWGSATLAERFLLRASEDMGEFHTVWEAAVVKYVSKLVQPENEDELGILVDPEDSFSAIRNKWVKEATEGDHLTNFILNHFLLRRNYYS